MIAVGLAVTLLLALGATVPLLAAGALATTPGETGSHCELAKALAAARETKPAKKVYVEELQRDPSSECAAKGLANLNPPPQATPEVDQCAVGDAYRDTGRDEEAAGAYGKALEEDPNRSCATDGLEATGPSAATRTAEEITGSIPTALTFLALLGLLYYALLFLCHWDRLKEKLVLMGRFGDHVKHVLRPRLTFTDFTDGAVQGSPGAALTARVKERLGWMREEALSKVLEYDLDFGTPREEFADQVSESKALQTAIDSAGEVSEQTKLIAALIKIISAALPIRRFAVSGTLEPPASAAAVVLMLEEDGSSEAATCLQGPTGEEIGAKDYMPLANPAAVWVQYGVASTLAGEEWDENKAQSQALLREGLDRYDCDEPEDARNAFDKAIVCDPANWGAYVSLAVAEARLKSDYEKSIERILKGIEAMRNAGPQGHVVGGEAAHG